MAGVVPKTLNELTQNMRNAIVTALVITKTEPKYFLNKNSPEFQGVMTFTLRDSKHSVCNCRFWSNKERIEDFNRNIKIGDVINVVCPVVIFNRIRDDKNHKYLPLGTLPISLIVNDGESSLRLNDYHDFAYLNRLQELMFIPHKSMCEALKLSDVRFIYMTPDDQNANGSAKKPMRVDLVVMVGQMRKVKEIRCKGELAQCLDIVVFDDSAPDGVLCSIWQNAWIQRAQECWKPMETVLHLIDVDIVESSYHRCCILRKTSCTVIYENPRGEGVATLRQFATKMAPQNFELIGQSRRMETLPNPESIRTQMTVKQIIMRLYGKLKDVSEEFTAVLYGMVTHFDIDGHNSVIVRRCKGCQRIISYYNAICGSDQCQVNCTLTQTTDIYDYCYNVNIHLTDHTGSLVETRLTEILAAEILEASAINFEEKYRHNTTALRSIKERYILQRFEVKLLIKRKTASRRLPVLQVIALQPTNDLSIIANTIIAG